MQLTATNEGFTQWMEPSTQPHAIMYFTHKSNGHQFKKICYDNQEVQMNISLAHNKRSLMSEYTFNICYFE